jgi:CubicO group peptidase (beta-lactamase class C family)
MKKMKLPFLLTLLMLAVAVWWHDHGPLTLQGELNRFIRQQAVVSGSVAIARHGQIITNFEVGAAHAESTNVLRPIASLSKLLTAQAVALLVREGLLSLSDKLSDHLPELPYALDPGYREITVQQLLQHTAGFDRSESGDPLFSDSLTVRGCDAAIQTAVSRPLDHPPGQVTKYANVGYCLLGMLIERVTEQSYEEAVLQRLSPRGGDHQLTFGPPVKSQEKITAMFSTAAWRGLGAAGAWFANAETLARLLEPVQERDLVLSPLDNELDHAFFYGQSWREWMPPHRRSTHYGALPGSYAFAMKLSNASVVVVIFDGRPIDDEEAANQLIEIFKSRLL